MTSTQLTPDTNHSDLDLAPQAGPVPLEAPEQPRARASLGIAVPILCALLGLIVGATAGRMFAPTGGAATPPAARVDAAVVQLSSRLAQAAQLRVQPATEGDVAPQLLLVGTADFDQAKVAHVGGRTHGRITRVFVELGDLVEAGQPLVQIEAPELGEAVAELLGARAELVAARNHATRQSGLGRSQLATAQTVEDAQAEVSALAARVRGLEQMLSAMGVSDLELRASARDGTPPRFVTLRAPMAGEIVERHAVLGQVVDPTQPIVRIADLSSLWVLLDVYERDLPRVGIGDTAEIASENLPSEVLRGTVAHVSAQVDEETRTAAVRIEVDNTQRILRPGQFVHASVYAPRLVRRAVVVPRTAITPVDGTPSVFVQLAPNRYEARAVELGVAMGERVEIVRGLVAGEPLVVEGAFALKSELER